MIFVEGIPHHHNFHAVKTSTLGNLKLSGNLWNLPPQEKTGIVLAWVGLIGGAVSCDSCELVGHIFDNADFRTLSKMSRVMWPALTPLSSITWAMPFMMRVGIVEIDRSFFSNNLYTSTWGGMPVATRYGDSYPLTRTFLREDRRSFSVNNGVNRKAWSAGRVECRKSKWYTKLANSKYKMLDNCGTVDNAGNMVCIPRFTQDDSKSTKWGGRTENLEVLTGSPAITLPTNWSPASSYLKYLSSTFPRAQPHLRQMLIIEGPPVDPDEANVAAPFRIEWVPIFFDAFSIVSCTKDAKRFPNRS